jgi:O-antigen/teichoic acid export membrane protein
LSRQRPNHSTAGQQAVTQADSASGRVARNSALYFTSLALPAIAAVFLVRVTVHALGASRFGLLALAWAVAEGSGIFDFGLGRATVRFVADSTARGREGLREIVLASFFSQTAAGLVAGTLLFLFVQVLVRRVFTIPAAAIPEATAMLRVLALHLPVLFASAALRAALEGAQRFDISAGLRIPSSLAAVAVPAALASAGYSLVAIMWCLLAVRLTLALVTATLVSRTLLGGRWGVPSGWRTLREMLGYSGWVAVSTALGPLLGSFDRFSVGSVIGVTGLGYYTGAAEAANRFLLIPATAFSALLPALAATDSRGARDRALIATRAARRQLAALLFPLCLTLFAFAPDLLRVWLGPAFASNAGPALMILSVGVFFGGLAHLPLALLYGSNRPDLPAKIHVAEVMVHLPFTFLLVHTWGITGAAVAWTVRCAADLTLYEWASRRAFGACDFDVAEWTRTRRLLWAGVGLASAVAGSVWLHHGSRSGAVALVALGLAVYAAVGWARVLSQAERHAWIGILLGTRASVQ